MSARQSADQESITRWTDLDWNLQTAPSETDGLDERLMPQCDDLHCRRESMNAPAILGEQQRNPLDVCLNNPLLPRCQVFLVLRLRLLHCGRNRHRWRRNGAQHVGLAAGSWTTASIPTGKQLNAVTCPMRNNMYRRRYQPQLDPICGRDIQQWRHLVAPDPA